MTSTALASGTARHLGVWLVGISAIIWSTAGLFTKSVSADVWTILFWRGVFSAAFMFAYLAWRNGRQVLGDFAGLGWPGWSAAAIGAAATICFISAFKHTTVANVGIIYATAAFVAGLLAWLLMREATSRTTLIGATIALCGIVIMVGGSLGTPNLYGDFLALLMTIGMAIFMVMVRMYPRVPMVLAGTMSSVMLVVAALAMTDPFSVLARDLPWLIAFGSVFAAGTILLTEGTKLIPASQSALIGALETPLAPVWAWFFLAEWPPLATWTGGAVVMFAVLWGIRRESQL